MDIFQYYYIFVKKILKYIITILNLKKKYKLTNFKKIVTNCKFNKKVKIYY